MTEGRLAELPPYTSPSWLILVHLRPTFMAKVVPHGMHHMLGWRNRIADLHLPSLVASEDS